MNYSLGENKVQSFKLEEGQTVVILSDTYIDHKRVTYVAETDSIQKVWKGGHKVITSNGHKLMQSDYRPSERLFGFGKSRAIKAEVITDMDKLGDLLAEAAKVKEYLDEKKAQNEIEEAKRNEKRRRDHEQAVIDVFSATEFIRSGKAQVLGQDGYHLAFTSKNIFGRNVEMDAYIIEKVDKDWYGDSSNRYELKISGFYRTTYTDDQERVYLYNFGTDTALSGNESPLQKLIEEGNTPDWFIELIYRLVRIAL